MTASELLQEVRLRGAELRAVDDRIRCRYPDGALTDELRAAIRSQKGQLLQLLRTDRDLETPDQDHEVTLRIEAFRSFLNERPSLRGVGVPLLALPDLRQVEASGCSSCGGSLPDNQIRCAPCRQAARIVVSEVRAKETVTPHVGPCGELVIPFSADVAYRWWRAQDPEERTARFRAARIAAGLPPTDEESDS